MREVFWRRSLSAVTVCVFLVSLSGILRAQAPSVPPALKGAVVDQHGSAIPSAVVIIRNDASGFAGTYPTDGSGRFSVEALAAGVYSIEVTAPGFATLRRVGVKVAAGKPEDMTFTLEIAQLSEQITVSDTTPEAAKSAPSVNTIAARSAQSVINDEYIRNDISPVSDYSQIVAMSPGTFSFQPNGVGLGDTKTLFRGFSDPQYSITFDGIPFNDTNDTSHHSWAFFPSQFVGSTMFDRSPGSAASIGPSTFGGSINMLSRNLDSNPHLDVTGSYGTWGTSLVDAQYDSGAFGGGANRLFVDLHQMKSDGYETFDSQKRDAFSAKYQHTFANQGVLTVFTGIIRLNANTPNTNATRAQIQANGNNYLLSNDPSQPNYFGYNFYRVPTDFDYVGYRANLGGGWTIDDKLYTLSYYNSQHFNSATTISTTSATDKLNSYRKYGNLVPLSQTSAHGVFRTGLWSEYAMTDRFQIPSDPRTWIDAALPNFHEKFNTTTLQPYAEFEWAVTKQLHLTPGVKYAWYQQDFTQFADNGKTVGSLNGAPSVTHTADYDSWLPSFDAHYLLEKNWSVYGQYAAGSTIPPTKVFDVKNAGVSVLPNPTRTNTTQFGSVWQSGRMTFDVDTYHIHFQNAYSSSVDANGETQYFTSADSVTRGVEAEGNVIIGHGLSAYANGTLGKATYVDTGLHVQNAPGNTETLGLNYRDRNWSVGVFTKRVGQMFNDNGSTHEAVTIAPFTVTNVFINYFLHNGSRLSNTRVQLSANNLFNNQNIVGVTPASTATSVPAPGDQLTLLPGRSIALTMTVGLGKARP